MKNIYKKQRSILHSAFSKNNSFIKTYMPGFSKIGKKDLNELLNKVGNKNENK